MKSLILSYLLSVSLLSSFSAGQETSEDSPKKRLEAFRLDSEIVIDGDLNESFWQEISPAQGFVQAEPNEGQPASQDSEVRVAFDDENVYFGVICHEIEPHRIIVTDLRRDFESRDGDSFEIVVDTFDDDRNGFLFITNPGGAKLDAQLANDGRDINQDWDGVWEVRSKVNSHSWSAELAIPFKTLRFPKTGAGNWGINFLRRIRYKNEINTWSPIPRRYLAAELDKENVYLVSLSGDLTGLEGKRQARNLKVKPFAVAKVEKLAEAGSVNGDFDAGVDFKYGITSGLTLDGTLNTDFSQVEADEQQINLTRFPLFFPEKREFFLENSGIFQFGDVPGERGPNREEETQLFFSRRIGLSAQEDLVPILGGARLSGRVGAYSLGFLNVQTKETDEIAKENFTVLRLKRDILSSSDIGAVFLNRQSDAPDQYNRAVGVDSNFRFFDNFIFNSYFAKTQSPELSGQDQVWKFSSQWQDNFKKFQIVYSDIGENFNPEMGFVRRTGVRRSRARIELHPRPGANRFIREFHPHTVLRYFTDRDNRTLTKRLHYGLGVVFHDGSVFEVKTDGQFERLDEPFQIRPTVAIPTNDYGWTRWGVEYGSDRSKPISAELEYTRGDFFDGKRDTLVLGGILRPSHKLSFDFRYGANDVELPQGAFTTHLLLFRINYAFNPRMFLNGLIQYNSDTKKVSSNIRFNLIHRSLSDLFIVYNDQRETDFQRLEDRALVLKYTHLLDF